MNFIIEMPAVDCIISGRVSNKRLVLPPESKMSTPKPGQFVQNTKHTYSVLCPASESISSQWSSVALNQFHLKTGNIHAAICKLKLDYAVLNLRRSVVLRKIFQYVSRTPNFGAHVFNILHAKKDAE